MHWITRIQSRPVVAVLHPVLPRHPPGLHPVVVLPPVVLHPALRELVALHPAVTAGNESTNTEVA
jgi:hypothetical protein